MSEGLGKILIRDACIRAVLFLAVKLLAIKRD